MATGGVILGRFDGTPRLRVARPGFDVTDPDLSDQQLAFDSAWPEILTVLDANWNLTTGVATESWSYNGSTFARYYRSVSFPTLPWEPICIGWDRGLDGSGRVVYMQTMCSTHVDHCTFKVRNTAKASAYIIFANPLLSADTREADLSGSHGVLLGNHPTRGPGLYVSRKGADVLTCTDTDLRFDSNRQPFQIVEAGVVWATPYNSNPTGTAVWKISQNITLEGSYPNFPPILLLGGADTAGIWSAEITWLSASSFNVTMTTSTSQAIQYVIPAYDPTYVGGADTASTRRVRIDADDGLKISKRNIDVNTASGSQLLLDTAKSVLHVRQRAAHDAIPAFVGFQSTDLTDNAGGPPLGFYAGYRYGRWWCAGGTIATDELSIASPTGTVPSTFSYELAAWASIDKIWSGWASGHSSTAFRAAIVTHSAAYAGEEALYSGPALASESVYTDFASATVGGGPSNWSIRFGMFQTVGLRVAAVAGSVSGKAIWPYIASSTTYPECEATYDPIGIVGDCDMLFGCQLIGGPSTVPFEVMYKWSATDNYQVAGFKCDVSGGVATNKRAYYGYRYYSSIVLVGGSVYSATESVGSYSERTYGWSYGTWYWYRLNVKGGMRRIKVWPRGTPEPKGWLIAFAGPGDSTGRVGLHMYPNPTPQGYLDFISVCSTGRPAWGPV
ncbi:hypothetical protein V5F32_04820 [Xanthobacter oligotrophicus]|uniref:Minor tail protein n=1 Tax=Xanthobacter oligotrophicus TaxID=2607286 RepID=A0ABW6ZTU2_9HYPH